MEDVADPRAALDEVARQRDQLAERIRVPGWYVAVDLLALAVLFSITGIARRLDSWPRSSYVIAPVLFLAIMVFSQWPLVVRYVTGARLPANIRRAYPSMRRPFIATAVTYALGLIVGMVTAETAPWAIWVLCSLAFAVLVLIGQLRLLAAIRHDIRTGQVSTA